MWQEIEVNSILGVLGLRHFNKEKVRGRVTIGGLPTRRGCLASPLSSGASG
jgi:hypothetical protein